MIKKFFENTGRSLDQEVGEIEIQSYQLRMDPMLPGEEMVGELNDSEKKHLIWISLMEARINQTTLNEKEMTNPELIRQYNREMEEALFKIEKSWKFIYKSIAKRFPNKSLDVRENCKIVVSKESETNALEKVMRKRASILLNSNYVKLTRGMEQ